VSLLVSAPVILAQFGGFDGGGYEPPAPKCQRFKCDSGMKPVGNVSHKLWSYGCKDSGMNFLNMGSFNPNDPLGGMKNQGKNVDKCCVERDICKQTCGTTSEECHNGFQACSKKLCKGDQNCNLAAMMSDIKSGPEDDGEDEQQKKADGTVDWEADKKRRDCAGYIKSQKSACKCVAKDDWKDAVETNLKKFYKTYNPEKLDDQNEIKDLDDVWKKWKGKEPAMFQALATKYKAKAVKIKVKPTPPPPPPYTPPPPLSPEEKEKEDKRMEEQRKKWAEDDKKWESERKEREKKTSDEDSKRKAKRQEEKEAENERRAAEEEGETVEL